MKYILVSATKTDGTIVNDKFEGIADLRRSAGKGMKTVEQMIAFLFGEGYTNVEHRVTDSFRVYMEYRITNK